jgi:glycerate 2-kinase
MWRAAVLAAQPAACLPGHWPPRPTGRVAVIACGKAARPMALEAVAHYGGGCGGIVIEVSQAESPPTAIAGFSHFRASHPVPDAHSVAAAHAALDFASSLTPDDLLVVLLSGGGSALMCLPAIGVTLEEKQAISGRLLTSGATIQEINCVRKHLSRIKGGRLAMASPAPVIALAISDVPGDDPAVIASGPTVVDPTTADDALAVLGRYGIETTPAVRDALRQSDAGYPLRRGIDTRDRLHVVATGMTALQAAADWCRRHGIQPTILGDDLQGEARELAREHARLARELAVVGKAACLLSGGETTVALRCRPGRGGRNTEYALALALALGNDANIWALAADTDGIDGSGGHCGAVVDPQTLERASLQGVEAGDYLRRHDSATFFSRVGGLMSEGPTGTNVNDFRAILVCP